ncbi:hypothetical protein T4D_12450 [Trichinella pseudospiralis]|uniref:Uncharacterized protein n=1 Tax=Trichinella pseudospiralis TaxID=6337 RepID=A0A0V1DKZ6_TRIPS|nr:hypothetical protein T4D_12450 [Trichinella pseudospiralis]
MQSVISSLLISEIKFNSISRKVGIIEKQRKDSEIGWKRILDGKLPIV